MTPIVDMLASETATASARLRRFSFWHVIEPVFEHFVYPFYRTSSKSSFGKLWSSILLFTCLYFWLRNQPVPDSLTTMIQTLLVYVYATKPIQIARDHVGRKTSKNDGAAPDAPATEVPS